MKRQSVTVAVCAVLVALTFFLGWMPYGVFLLPTLFAACCFGLGLSFFSSTMFGIISLIYCFMYPAGSFTIGEYFRTYPWLPIVARMFIGPMVWFLYKGLLKLKIFNSQKTINKIIPIGLSAAIGSALNTLFIGFFVIVLKTPDIGNLEDITIGFLVVAGSIEMAINAVLLPPIVLTVRRALPKLISEVNQKSQKKERVTQDNI